MILLLYFYLFIFILLFYFNSAWISLLVSIFCWRPHQRKCWETVGHSGWVLQHWVLLVKHHPPYDPPSPPFQGKLGFQMIHLSNLCARVRKCRGNLWGRQAPALLSTRSCVWRENRQEIDHSTENKWVELVPSAKNKKFPKSHHLYALFWNDVFIFNIFYLFFNNFKCVHNVSW